MNNEDFNKCREFLEKLIVQDGINENALNVYAKLIEFKSIHDKEIEKSVIEKKSENRSLMISIEQVGTEITLTTM